MHRILQISPPKCSKCVEILFKPTPCIRCSSSLCVCAVSERWLASRCPAACHERGQTAVLCWAQSRVWEFTRWQRQMTAERKQPAGRTPPYLTLPRLDHPFRNPLHHHSHFRSITLILLLLRMQYYQSISMHRKNWNAEKGEYPFQYYFSIKHSIQYYLVLRKGPLFLISTSAKVSYIITLLDGSQDFMWVSSKYFYIDRNWKGCKQ